MIANKISQPVNIFETTGQSFDTAIDELLPFRDLALTDIAVACFNGFAGACFGRKL